MVFSKKNQCSLGKGLTSGLKPGMDKISLEYLVPESKKVSETVGAFVKVYRTQGEIEHQKEY